MSKRKDTYSFTTTPEDSYLERVLAEASPKTNFLLIRESSTLTGETNLVLLAKEEVVNAVGEQFPGERLAGTPLGQFIIERLTRGPVVPGYYVAACGGLTREEAAFKEEGVLSEINRLENILTERVIKVTVQSR